MADPQKIITMTELALYDKHEGTHDRAASEYFRHDFIYKKNLSTRLAVGLGGLFILALYWLRVFLIDGTDILEMEAAGPIRDSVLFMLALLAVYSLIGTVQATREYYLIQKRLKKYETLVNKLERV